MEFFENDADYDMAELTRKGNIVNNLKKKGICVHGWRQGGDPENPYKDSTCLDCGKKARWCDLETEAQNYF